MKIGKNKSDDAVDREKDFCASLIRLIWTPSQQRKKSEKNKGCSTLNIFKLFSQFRAKLFIFFFVDLSKSKQNWAQFQFEPYQNVAKKQKREAQATKKEEMEKMKKDENQRKQIIFEIFIAADILLCQKIEEEEERWVGGWVGGDICSRKKPSPKKFAMTPEFKTINFLGSIFQDQFRGYQPLCEFFMCFYFFLCFNDNLLSSHAILTQFKISISSFIHNIQIHS